MQSQQTWPKLCTLFRLSNLQYLRRERGPVMNFENVLPMPWKVAPYNEDWIPSPWQRIPNAVPLRYLRDRPRMSGDCCKSIQEVR